LVHRGEIWRSRYADILPSEDPFTEAVLAGGELSWVENGLTDPRYAHHPLVVGPPYLRFTVAVPIRLEDGSTPGVLSVSGQEPQLYDARKASRLKDIADFVADEWARAHAVAAQVQLLLERDQALERSERSQERLKIALALADIHVWEMNFKRRELSKEGAEDTFFAEPQTFEALHRDLFLAVDPRDRAAVRAAWDDHIRNGMPYRPEHRIRRRDGREVWALSSAQLFVDEQGRPERLVGALQNITMRKQAELALQAAKTEADAANRAKSDFLATMSHELRTPLNAILGFAEMIKDQVIGPAPPHYVGYAADIYESGRHLLELVNDVLDIAKLEAGKVELHETEFAMRDLLLEVTASFAKQAQSAHVAMVQAIGEIPPVRADRRLMKQVLLNLLSNALKFTPAQGRVTVSARYVAGFGLEVTISDTGIGMSAGEVDIALTAFGQVNSKIARDHKGTGLGLPISRSLVRLHGGEMHISSAPQEGTQITFVLPQSRVVSPRRLSAAS
ncbi:MAG TPA: GAF domain-containing sensor histidine kinase, partial [Rhizomicrobium sp.]|nr:GAF domain-containing sensor histidine kinase [Rhizomicrobium sp.]